MICFHNNTYNVALLGADVFRSNVLLLNQFFSHSGKNFIVILVSSGII